MDDVWEETVKGTVGLEQVRGVRAHAHVTSVLSLGDVDGLSRADASSDGAKDWDLRVTHKALMGTASLKILCKRVTPLSGLFVPSTRGCTGMLAIRLVRVDSQSQESI
jgi:hypothetical protein